MISKPYVGTEKPLVTKVKSGLIISFLALCGLLLSGASAKADEGISTSSVRPMVLEGRFVVYLGMAPVILDSKLRKSAPKTYLEAIKEFGPAFVSNHSGIGAWEWYFDDGKVLWCGGPYGKTLNSKFDAQLKDSTRITIPIGPNRQKQAEQVGADQPATSSEEKPKGNETPQPESKIAPR